jgi:hypothetical protein
MSSFKERRESILGIFTKAQQDLEILNSDVQDQIETNAEKIKKLTDENTDLTNFKAENLKVIKTFQKIFK